MSFDEVRFPVGISLGATGGPERRTEVVTLASGREERNALWANSRRRYNIGYGIKTTNDLHSAIAFFEARDGRLRGFRFKDWSDFKSGAPQSPVTYSDQAFGVGDGTRGEFQIIKSYTSGLRTWVRTIHKPIAETVIVAVNGVPQTRGTHFNVNEATGVITFVPGSIPANGHVVAGGYEYDVPVRFDTDYLAVSLGFRDHGEIPDIPIVELRL